MLINVNILLKFWSIILIVTCFSSNAHSQELDYSNVKLQLWVENDSIGPLDPLFYQLCLMNMDETKSKDLLKPWTVM